LYICPWSLGDPLCQSQSLPYIRGLVEDGYRFALMTFESEQYRPDEGSVADKQAQLAAEGISWYPVSWPAGNSMADKLAGITAAVMTGVKVCRRHHPRLIHSRSSLTVFAAVTLEKLFRTKYLYDADSLLSQEYLDVGHLTPESRGFKFLAWTEKWGRANADRIIVLTKRLREIYEREFAVRVPIDVIPCCVDTEKFTFDPDARASVRSDLGVGDAPLMVYVGKTGSWYMVDETFGFFKDVEMIRPGCKLLIVSREDPRNFAEVATRAGISDDSYMIRSAEHSEVPRFLSASDVGLSLVKPLKSKLGSSPVKFAEYLSAGLPVVTTEGIGDCTEIVKANDVGVVVAETGSAERLGELLRTGKGPLVGRCRLVAEEVYSLTGVGIRKYRENYHALLGPVE
jgi:glycosyltransferase involved in cell wall biosynthesis